MDAWRLIDSGPGSGAVNMARDQALFDDVKAGGRPALRFYAWKPACLSLGRNQRARGRLRGERAATPGIDIVRRPTGGMAVHHDRELTYAVAVPVGELGSPRETYRAVNRALVAGLRTFGVRAEVAGAAEGSPGREPVCFRAPEGGEVVVGRRKLVGSAQRCERRTVLQHGSLLLAGGQRRAAELLDARAAVEGAVALAALLDPLPERAALVAALASGFETELGIRLARAEQEDDGRVQALERRFRSAGWTWRR